MNKGTLLAVDELEFNGGSLNLELNAAHGMSASIVVSNSFKVAHRPIRINLSGAIGNECLPLLSWPVATAPTATST